MDINFVFTFITEHPIAHVANVHMGKPHVRAMMVYKADEDGIVLHTSKTKDLYKQLSVAPEVELCFNDYMENIQVRVSGSIEFEENLEIKKEIVAAREKLQPWIHQVGFDMLAVIRLRNGFAHVWMPELTFLPKRFLRL